MYCNLRLLYLKFKVNNDYFPGPLNNGTFLKTGLWYRVSMGSKIDPIVLQQPNVEAKSLWSHPRFYSNGISAVGLVLMCTKSSQFASSVIRTKKLFL